MTLPRGRAGYDAAFAPVWGVPVPLPSPGPLPRRAEVVVIGGGIAGVSMLRHLVDRGVDAILVERWCVGSGASGRNAGFLLAGVAENYAAAVARYGRAVAAAVWTFTAENHAMLASLPEIVGCGYHRRGSWTVAMDADEAAALEASATLLREDGFHASLSRTGPVGSRLVLVNDADGEVDPLRLVRALAVTVRGRVHEDCTVVAVEDGAAEVVVHLRDGAAVTAATVVLAINAWTSTLVPTVRIRPVRAQMLGAAGEGTAVACPVYAEHGHRYWRQLDDGTVIVGGFRNRAEADEVGDDLTPTDAVQRHLETQLHDLGVHAAVTSRWCGTMGFSSDGLPLAGRVPSASRLHLAAGFTGHGMGFATRTTDVLTSHIVDGHPLPGWLDAARDLP